MTCVAGGTAPFRRKGYAWPWRTGGVGLPPLRPAQRTGPLQTGASRSARVESSFCRPPSRESSAGRLKPIFLTLLELFDSPDLEKDGQMRLPRYASGVLGDLAQNPELQFSGAEHLRELGNVCAPRAASSRLSHPRDSRPNCDRIRRKA